jgi:hypothetical protein
MLQWRCHQRFRGDDDATVVSKSIPQASYPVALRQAGPGGPPLHRNREAGV